MIAATSSWAQSADDDAARAIVEKDLLRPLALKESRASRFTRAMLPATARRVQISEGARGTDADGRAFVSFVVEEHRGYELEEDDADEAAAAKWKKGFVGCVYPDTKEIFVKKGAGYQPGSLLLGKRNATAVKTTVCQAGTTS